MKLNKYFLIGAMGLGLFACSDDLNENGQVGNEQNGGKTYVAIALNYGTSSRDVVDGDYNDTDLDEAVAKEESKVTSLRIIVASNGTAEKNETYDISEFPTKPYVLEITSGQKDFYAIINEDAEYTETDDLEDYLNKNVNKTALAITTGATNKGFLMTGKTSKYINPEVEKDEAADMNPVELTVDRVAAKVTVTSADNLNNNLAKNISKIGNIEFAIGNADLNATTGDGFIAATMAGFFRIAQTDNKTPYYEFVPKEGTSYTHTAPTAYSPITISNQNSKAKSLYCLENTHASGSYKQGNTTYAAFKVPIYLKTAVTFTYTPESEPSTAESATVDNLEENVTYEQDADPKAFYYIYAPENLRGRYILSSHIDNLKTQMNITEEGAEGRKQVINKLTKLVSLSISDEYKDGHGYYKTWLNPDGNAENSPVLRNNWYEMNITKLTLPGNPEEPGIDPTDPLTPPTNASVTVTLRKWNYVKHDVELQN